MPYTKEQEAKTVTIDDGNEITANTQEAIKDDSQSKEIPFTQSVAAMVGMRLKHR